MKRIKQLIFVFSLLGVILFSSYAYAEKTVYKAGILNDYIFSGNNIIQYTEDSVQSAFDYVENTEIDFAELDLKTSLNALDNGTIDFLCMVPWNDTVSAYVDYASKPVATGFLALFTSADNNRIYFEDFSKLKNAKIGLI